MSKGTVEVRLGPGVTDELYRREKFTHTAHASADGVAMLLHQDNDQGHRTEIISINRYGKDPAFAWSEQLNHQSVFAELEAKPMVEEESFYEEARKLSNLQAFGHYATFSELAEENINYTVLDSDIGFVEETIDLGNGRKVTLPGELRGIRELKSKNGGDLLEPVTVDEALAFIQNVFCSYLDVTPEQAEKSLDFWLIPTLKHAVQFFEEQQELFATMKQVRMQNVYELYKISEEDFRRMKISAQNENVGAPWSWQANHCIGERESVVLEQARQNDVNYTKQDQYQLPEDLVDGKPLFEREYELSKNMNLFDSLYYRGGELKPDGSRAKPGENRGSSEYARYLRRCSQRRDELFADKLWKILTWPLPLAEAGMKQLRKAYRNSVKECSPGPQREMVDGRWQTVPLVGDAAVNWIRRRGKGTLAGKRVSKNIQLHTGESWNNLILTKKHMDSLEEALLWRKGIVRTTVDGQTIEETFNQNFEGLPYDYVVRTYGKNRTA